MTKKEYARNILIGAFVVASLALGTWLLFFLSPETGDAAQRIRVRFTDIDKVTIGTRVTFGGQPIGEVVKVRQIPEARRQKASSDFDIYIYELILTIDSSVTVFNTDAITVRTSGLLGEKSISIMPRKPREGIESFPVTESHILRAESGGSVEEALMELEGLAGKAGQALDEIIHLVSSNQEDVSLAIKSVHQSLGSFTVLMDRMNELDVANRVSKAAENVGGTMERLSKQLTLMEEGELVPHLADVTKHLKHIMAAIDQPEKLSEIVVNVHKLSEGLDKLQGRVNGSWDKVDLVLEDFSVAGKNTRELTESLKGAAQRVSELFGGIAEGEGSLGRLLKSDDFYLRVVSVMNKLETVMNDVNHYGILFHLDKGWQRQRVRRMNILHDLASPQQFRDYFEEEVDQINTSLYRVGVLLRKIDDEGSEHTLENDHFRQVFAELLRQVEGLEAALKLYNSSLIEVDAGL